MSPLLGPLLVYVLVAPRTLSSMIGGSGMPTWVPRKRVGQNAIRSGSFEDCPQLIDFAVCCAAYHSF